MLTRSQVARRLGKSIATVRRLERRALHPTRDGRGVHWFDPGEVDALAMRRGLPSAARSTWFESTRPLVCHGAALTPAQANDSERRRRAEAAELDQRRAVEQQTALATARADALALLAAEVCTFIEALSHRQVSQVGVPALERLLAVVSGLETGGLLPREKRRGERASRTW